MSTTMRPVPSREDPGPAPDPDRPPETWPRLLAVCLLLTGLVFVQEPGRIATDTKLDLTADPLAFLGRALHLWEPTGFFGQVQNQAYGYLFPMGPFFGLGDLIDAPEWVVQRSWWALLLSLAFLGAERLATSLGIGLPWTRVVAGVLYALSPRMLTVIGPSSVEILPMAMAPWVVLPLVHGSRTGSPRRAAALSGLALVAAGGVNAVATAAAAVPAALFLLTRAPGARARRLTGWWLLSAVLATMWWLIPLVVLGRYSPPFLDWIESASVTTSVTSVAASLRGVSQWVAYLTTPAGPELRAGWQLITLPAVVLHTMLVVALGVAGLALPRLRERLWLVSGLLVGVFLVTLGHVGPVDGGLADGFRSALDGVLAPLRNTHKFDLVLRLPLVLGAAHALAWGARALTARTAAGLPRVPVALRLSAAGLLAVVVLGATAPLSNLLVVPRGSYDAIPDYWTKAARWLEENPDGGTALVVPGASFGTFVWGRTRDEPLQALSDRPWAVRDAVPLTPAGTIRALDAVQRRLVTGSGSPGLAALLGRMGVDHLVVRNDLDPLTSSAPRPVAVHAALASSPGLRRVAAFGPVVGSSSTPDQRVDQGLDVGYPAVEIWAVGPAQPRVSLVPEASVLTVVGGPESLLDLSDRGLPPSRPVLLAGDRQPVIGAGTVLTDGMRRREVNFGSVDRSASFTLGASDPLRRQAAARDYLPFDGYETVTRWIGLRAVRVSSSAGDADALGEVQPAHQPWAALDGEPTTAWMSSGRQGAVGQWLTIDFSRPLDIQGATVTVGVDPSGTTPSRITVTTDTGAVDQPVRPGWPVPLDVSSTPTRRLTVSLASTATPPPGRSFVITELHVPGLAPGHPLVTPASGASAYLTTADGATRSCLAADGTWLCAAGSARPGEENGLDRVVLLDPHRVYQLRATVVPRPGPELDRLLDRAWPGAAVTASSAAVDDPAARPQVVLDGDRGTGWVAAPLDDDPALTVRLAQPRRLTGLRLQVDPALPASAPASVVVESTAGTRTGELDDAGRLRFAPLVTDELRLTFPTVQPVQSYDQVQRLWSLLPVGVSELQVRGAEDLTEPSADAVVRVRCGRGPAVGVGDRQVELSVAAPAADVLAGAPLTATACPDGEPVTAGGLVRVRLPPTAAWRPRSVDLVGALDVSQPLEVSPLAVAVDRWTATDRTLELAERAEPSVLVVRENANDGWVATLAGDQLEPLVVDGWQQGWRVPAGEAGTIRLEYRPDRPYRLGLGLGALAVLVLVALAAWPGRGGAAPVGPARWAPPLLAGLVVGGLWLVGDWVGVAAGLVGLGLAWGTPARWVPLLGLLAGACIAGAAVVLAAAPWGTVGYAGGAAAPQVACLAALSLVTGVLVAGRRRRGSHRNP